DFMPPRGENPDIIRIVEGLRGKVSMQMELIIRFDYGQIVPWVRQRNGGLEAIAGPDGLILRTPIETCGKDLTTVAEFAVSDGESGYSARLLAVLHRCRSCTAFAANAASMKSKFPGFQATKSLCRYVSATLLRNNFSSMCTARY